MSNVPWRHIFWQMCTGYLVSVIQVGGGWSAAKDVKIKGKQYGTRTIFVEIDLRVLVPIYLLIGNLVS